MLLYSYHTVAELASQEDSYWNPEDDFFKTPEEGLAKTAEHLVDYAKKRKRTEMDETDKMALEQ